MHLVARYTGYRVVGGTNLGGLVGGRGDVVTRQGRRVGEERPRQLHTITGVPSEANHEVISINYLIV